MIYLSNISLLLLEVVQKITNPNTLTSIILLILFIIIILITSLLFITRE